MAIGGMGYIPKNRKWIIKCIRKNISQIQENLIEIWNIKNGGDQITFCVDPSGMEFELFINFPEKRSVVISGILPTKDNIFRTDSKRYPLTRK